MESLRIAIATIGLGSDLRDSIATASKTGAAGVQFDLRSEITSSQAGETASRQIRYLLEERNMQLASTTFPLRRPLYDPVEIDGRVEVVKEAMKLASRLQCRILTLRVGRIPGEDQVDDQIRLHGALSDLARLGAHIGVTPTITTSGDSADTLRKLVESIKDGPVAVDLDPASCIISQLDPAQHFRSLHDLTVHVQGRDAVRDLETGGQETVLGRGETSWEELIAMMADARYPGWMTVRRTSGTNLLGDLVNAIRYLRALSPLG